MVVVVDDDGVVVDDNVVVVVFCCCCYCSKETSRTAFKLAQGVGLLNIK